mmetsp:Transcript_88090/g.184099  ORF Transcript_88090/g.184099 Transcript_88090/m.184099 type:complete len:218 (+) Transcript_88090:926-1579(+)
MLGGGNLCDRIDEGLGRGCCFPNLGNLRKFTHPVRQRVQCCPNLLPGEAGWRSRGGRQGKPSRNQLCEHVDQLLVIIQAMPVGGCQVVDIGRLCWGSCIFGHVSRVLHDGNELYELRQGGEFDKLVFLGGVGPVAVLVQHEGCVQEGHRSTQGLARRMEAHFVRDLQRLPDGIEEGLHKSSRADGTQRFDPVGHVLDERYLALAQLAPVVVDLVILD